MAKTHHGSAPEGTAVGTVSNLEHTAACDRALQHDLDTVRKLVRNRFGDRVSALVLGGSFGRGEGCFWNRHGAVVPGNNLDLFLVSPKPLQQQEVEAIQREILAESYVESVVITRYVEDDLSRLPPTLETFDLTEGGQILDGDVTKFDYIPSYDSSDMPLWEAERLLRGRLVTLIEAFPRGNDSLRSFYYGAKSVFAGVDALLIRNKVYTSSYREKVLRFQQLVEDPHLLRLVDASLTVKVSGRTPDDYTVESFWATALRFQLDSLLGLFQSRGSCREERLRHLLSRFHYLTTSPRRTFKNRARMLFLRNVQGNVERLLLALTIARDVGAPELGFSSIRRRAGVAPFHEWVEGAKAAVDRWYTLPRP